MSTDELLTAYNTGPRIHDYFGKRIVRISKSLVMKGGPEVTEREAHNMRYALEKLSLPLPKVHCVFTVADKTKTKVKIPVVKSKEQKGGTLGSFIVMDYIHGKTVEQYWDTADLPLCRSVAKQVADIVNKMQSTPVGDTLPLGPISDAERSRGKWTGPWFTDYGAGPFASLEELEAWLNHKIDVCIRVQELPADWPRFELKEADLVLTHQDIAPRNLIVDVDSDGGGGGNPKVWLVDWQCAGVFPRGFEQAVLREQAGGIDEFVDMVEGGLVDKREDMVRQFRGIQFAMSTGWPM